jgi:hypothetical protein
MTFEQCYICKRYGHLETHHVYNAANRKISERWGMVVKLCPACHRTSKYSVHLNYESNLRLKQEFQMKFEQEHSRELFMKEFMRNYLD